MQGKVRLFFWDVNMSCKLSYTMLQSNNMVTSSFLFFTQVDTSSENDHTQNCCAPKTPNTMYDG